MIALALAFERFFHQVKRKEYIFPFLKEILVSLFKKKCIITKIEIFSFLTTYIFNKFCTF